MKVLHHIGLTTIIIGFLIMMGAAGTSDIDPTVTLWELLFYALSGMALMVLGALLAHRTMD